MNKIKVSVGIPVYNEEGNIGYLLSSILSQKAENFDLIEIIVVSDKSTDRTVEIIKTFSDPRIKLVEHTVRVGQQKTQNEILELYKGDLLVISEGDTLPKDDLLIAKLIAPFLESNILEKLAMVVGRSIAIKPRTFFENILVHNHRLKQELFDKWGDMNLYMCGGHAMKVLPRWFTDEFKWPDNVPEDSYIYLWIKNKGYEIKRQSDALVLMKNVENFSDRLKQCSKYHGGRKALGQYFDQKFIDVEYNIPKGITVEKLVKSFVTDPFWVSLVLLEMVVNRVFTKMGKEFNRFHPTYTSSKQTGIVGGALHDNYIKKYIDKTVTVGISALNEEANIKPLLLSILNQSGGFQLQKIIVISDGSTDNTVKFVNEVSDSRIVVVDDGVRKGKSERQNEIFEMSDTDIVVIVDADTLPADNSFIDELIKPIVEDPGVGITSGPNTPVSQKNFIEKTLAYGVKFKTDLFESMRPDNLFLCIGGDRAFSREFYKRLRWPAGFSEDAYSYLKALELGFKFKYAKKAKILFRVPDNIKDHLKQSRRFVNHSLDLGKYFSMSVIKDNYAIPKSIFIIKMIKYFFVNPILSTFYIVLTIYPRIFKANNTMKDKWDAAISTKKLTN